MAPIAEEGEQQPQQAEEKILRRPVSNKIKRKYLDLIEQNEGLTAYRAWKRLKREHPNEIGRASCRERV